MILFGIRCCFTDIVSARLRERGTHIVATLLPGVPSMERPLPLAGPHRPLLPAGSQSAATTAQPAMSVFHVGQLASPATLRLVESLAPDVIVVACYPRRIPSSMYRIASSGAINIHPSLLPTGRGPDPLFWTFKRGDGHAGVTVHELSGRLDAGAILAQQELLYPDGETEAELESRLAVAGADLAIDVIDDLVSGRGRVHRIEQDESRATYEPWPVDDDLVIDTSHPARSIFNFVRGIAGRGQPTVLHVGDNVYEIIEALDYGQAESIPQTRDADEIDVHCADGIVRVRVRRGTPIQRPN